VYQDSFRHPFTTMGEELFDAAWAATPRDADRPASRPVRNEA
jgi:hypothetical protein